MNTALQRAESAHLEHAIRFYLTHPVEWVQDLVFTKPEEQLDEWQKQVLQSLHDRRRVTIRSGHGVGKTFTIACAVLWFLVTHPYCKIICTAPTKDQLFDVLWAQLAALIRGSQKLSQLVEWQQERIVMKSNPEEWFAAARTAEVRKVGKTGQAFAEGIQGRHAQAIMFVIDEASGIDEAIMSAVDGALTTEDSYIIMTGNPTRSSGTFYRSFHRERSQWATFHINSEESPRVTPSYVPWMLKKYGSRDHPMYLIRVRGEFPPEQYNSLFSISDCEEAKMLNLEATQFDPYEIGVDVARYGDNLTAIAVKHGPVIERVDTYAQQSLMETTGRVIQYITKYRPMAVKIDVVGIGAGVYDRLRELRYKEVIPVHNGARPMDDEHYVNLRAESIHYLAKLIKDKRIKLPDDETLIEQMVSLTFKLNSRGRMQIITKEELRDLGIDSPDRLDAVVLAAFPTYSVQARHTRAMHMPIFGR